MYRATPSLAYHLPLLSPLTPFPSSGRRSSITQIRGESASTSRGYIADTRASVINSRPRWRTVVHPLRRRQTTFPPFVHLVPVSALVLAHGNRAATKAAAWRDAQGSLARNTHESLPLKYRSDFLLVPGNVLRSLLTRGHA